MVLFTQLRRENAANVCVECARRDLGEVVDISPYGIAEEPTRDWDGLFQELTECPVVLKLEFSSLNKEKFQVCDQITNEFASLKARLKT